MTGAKPGAPAAGCASRAVTRDTHAAPCARAERDHNLAEKQFRSQHLHAKRAGVEKTPRGEHRVDRHITDAWYYRTQHSDFPRGVRTNADESSPGR